MQQDTTPAEIHHLLTTALPGADVCVADESAQHARHTRGKAGTSAGGGHYMVTVVWPGFDASGRVARERRVHEILQPLLAAGRIHALGLTLSAEPHA